ncbi:MAG TPA: divergent polysaccharide deacetylase family protein [Thermoanaerobaculia bacterium]|nr:divergent polysaccharide deacetylase family protein [Thermoanaerobaculia bacterium]
MLLLLGVAAVIYFGCRDPSRQAGDVAGAAGRHEAAAAGGGPSSSKLRDRHIAGLRHGPALSPPRAGDEAVIPGREARVALVIDDLGRSLGDLDTLKRLGIPLTYAVLPFESQTSEVVAALRRRGEEILCHLPMEPASGGNPGPGALRLGMTREQLHDSTLAAIAAVPGAVGVNNHMGSSLSADAGSMATILGALRARGLYFLDSRTSSRSVGYRLATALGIPAAERQVFLDDDQRPEAISAQFHHLLDLARDRGEAIAIGHPHSATLAALAGEVPRAMALGYRFVLVSSLLDRPARRPE